MTHPNLRCPKCHLLKIEAGNQGSLTQWLVSCRCRDNIQLDGAHEDEPQKCNVCNKRIPSHSSGSLTQWVFRGHDCKCSIPQIATGTGPTLDTSEDDSSFDDEPELPLDEDCFPKQRYKPIAEIGQGSSGVVYRCIDRMLRKHVAVKCLHTLSGKQLVDFQNEARVTSQLKHPGIVSIMDFGCTASGAPFMVMEYITGQSLEQYLQENGSGSIELFTNIFSIACEALHHAHERGIFHRDLKSSNLILTFENPLSPQIKIIDFGVAAWKTQSESGNEAQRDTLVGTPAYMPPDQAMGLAFSVQSEIYSLGCVMFEFLTGRPPFVANTALETINLHATQPAPALSEVRDDLVFPNHISDIINRCLKKDPAQRPGSMKEVFAALQDSRFYDRLLTAKAPAVLASGSNWKGALGLGIACALIASCVVFRWTGPFSEKAQDDYVKQALDQLSRQNINQAIDLSNRALKKNRKDAKALDALATAYLFQEQPQKALRTLDDALKTADLDNRTRAQIHYHKAVALFCLNRPDARAELTKAIDYEPCKWETAKFDKWIETKATKTPTNSFFPELQSPEDSGDDNTLKVYVQENPNCNSVELNGPNYTAKGLEVLSKLPLAKFTLNDSPLKDDDLKALEKCKYLTEICTWQCNNLDGSFLKYVRQAPLACVRFSSMAKLSDRGLDCLSGANPLKVLLVIDAPNVTGSGFRNLHMEFLNWQPYKGLNNGKRLSVYPPFPLSKLQESDDLDFLVIDSDALSDEEFAEIALLKQLKELTISGKNSLRTERIKYMAKLPGLKMIAIDDMRIDDQCAREFVEKFRHHQLERLSLIGTNVEDAVLERLFNLDPEKMLVTEPTELSFAMRKRLKFDDDKIVICHPNCTNESLKKLVLNKPNPKEKISLDGGRYTSEGLAMLSQIQPECLDVTSSPLTDEEFYPLKKFTKLKYLGLSNSKITGSCLKYVQPSIQDLAFADLEHFNDDALLCLSGKHLNSIVVQNCPSFSGIGLKYPAAIDIVTWRPNLGADGSRRYNKYAMTAMQNMKLVAMEITPEDFSDEEFAGISNVHTNGINLVGGGQKLSNAKLAATLRIPKLSSILIAGLKFDAKAMDKFSERTKLKHLHLQVTDTTDDDMIYISRMPLQTLTMDETRLTKACLKSIQNMGTLRSLNFMVLPRSITVNDMQNLQKAMPACKVSYPQ